MVKARGADLVEALRTVARGNFFLSEPLSRVPIERWMQSVRALARDPYEALTNREREVLQLVAEGSSNEGMRHGSRRRRRSEPGTGLEAITDRDGPDDAAP